MLGAKDTILSGGAPSATPEKVHSNTATRQMFRTITSLYPLNYYNELSFLILSQCRFPSTLKEKKTAGSVSRPAFFL
jgi:hypothetical protein